ncbi:bifunctional UDP-N-acetylglucosamine pyrophosphorylase/glucosamine-1-phosphate N-acetyltransferase [Alkalihalobacillus xiaoxiensis]|uniref:Bifunctional protein GlmU n=1 Tax=Shouchella xiaoxiensis TaxID=766895 RepID=A0ABS2T1Z7_9BACI|nr:bifunctional UDP-N-acetylglucosamine diphosphorylase/glucosamine-1-phosphate N-acetyltransferase GlmU [Shouchella xiaoxiensis]MBM7841286.1 bifunctional UDP-N-acetylglucosamine pyrophosphorylase/glucosamine-1-phosphate N-acetyltransferase [Shouchella xiaoxiensis]
MSGRYAVILAAGQGTRMKSKLYKVLHPVCGKSMVEHVVDQVTSLSFDETAVVIGHGAELVKKTVKQNVHFVLQEEQLGTGHAVKCSEHLLADKSGTTVVLCGDTPLITSETITKLMDDHIESKAKATILTAHAEDPTGYGRVIRSETGKVEKIVEQKDASEAEKKVQEINTGIFCFDNAALFSTLKKVKNNNAQGEYYLPDVIELLKEQGELVSAYKINSLDETIGVNDRIALSKAEALMKDRINHKWMSEGVTLIDPQTTYISAEAIIGRDTTMHPNVTIKGESVIGEDCIIESGTEIHESTLEDHVHVRASQIVNSYVKNGATIGPFAHIRPDSSIGQNVKIGNFVELKKTKIDDGSKVSHLSYVGDAIIGTDVNVGCGVVTVNYDGENKHQTTIADGAFIGSGSNLIAPVTVGERAFIAAGSTITDQVPDYALSIARSRQVNKENYVKKDRQD